MILRVIKSSRGDVGRDDVVVRVLLHDVDGVELVFAGKELLDKPGAVIGPVPKNLRGHTEQLAA